MKVNEATIVRIRELSKAQRLSMYELSYRTGMPPSTVKSIMNGKSKNPGRRAAAALQRQRRLSLAELQPKEKGGK